MNVTERLVAELNELRGLSYPMIGHIRWSDIKGDGRYRPSLWTITNPNGGVSNSEYNAATSRQRCAKLRAAIAKERGEVTPESLPVIFRMEGGRGEAWSAVAVFPTVVASLDNYGMGDVTIYAHIGQHGAAHRGWYNRTRKATPDQCASLKAELDSIYAPEFRLVVAQRWTRHHDAIRRADWTRMRNATNAAN